MSKRSKYRHVTHHAIKAQPYIDPFGNGRRYIIHPKHGLTTLEWAYEHGKDVTENARKYVENRKWDRAVDILEKSLLGLIDEQKTIPQTITAE